MNAQSDVAVGPPGLVWGDLEIFLISAQEGGLSAASRRLGINHATASRRVARLEEELGVRLFDRSVRGVVPSAAGEELLLHVAEMQKHVDAIWRKVAGRDAELAGPVLLTTIDDLAFTVLPGMLKAFHLKHPAVQVQLDVRAEISDLARRQADLALRFGNPPQDPNAVRRQICSFRNGIYASPAYLRRRGTPQDLASLRQHALIVGDAGLAKSPVNKILVEHGDPDQIVLRSNLMAARMAAARAGMGLAVLPDFVGARERQLRRVPIADADSTAGLWLVIHEDVRSKARVRALADFAVEYLADRLRTDG